MHLYPEVKLERARFLPGMISTLRAIVNFCCIEQFWKEAEYRKSFLLNYASKENFDPLVPENWYNVDYAAFLSWKVNFNLAR